MAGDAAGRDRFDGCLVSNGGWRATETKDRRLWFHPADFPVRVWAVAINPEGVAWAEAETILGIDNTYVHVRYSGEPARLSREKLARSWTLYRNVFFTSSRSGYAARSFDEMWRQRYWRPVTAAPPAMQMSLADAIKLLGVPADFTREDIIAAFRRQALRCHPDHGGTEAQFIELVKARDRLLAALGTRAAAPKMPEFAPKGARLRMAHGARAAAPGNWPHAAARWVSVIIPRQPPLVGLTSESGRAATDLSPLDGDGKIIGPGSDGMVEWLNSAGFRRAGQAWMRNGGRRLASPMCLVPCRFFGMPG